MFGFSLTKIVFTAVIVYVVWNAFKYFTRVQDQRAERSRVKNRGGGAKASAASKSAPKSSPPPAQEGVEDMVECKACGAYVTRGAKSCGRDDCPFSG